MLFMRCARGHHKLACTIHLRSVSRLTSNPSWAKCSAGDGTRWGVPREEVCAGLRGAQVKIERRLDGSHWLRFRGRYLRLRHCPAPLRSSASPSGLRPPGLAERRAKPKDKIKPKYHVPAHHPWRKPWNRTFLSCEKPDISTLR